MDAIYRDAYPDVFATFDDCFEDLRVASPAPKEDAKDVKILSE